MFSTLRAAVSRVRPSSQLCAALSQQSKVSQPAVCQSTATETQTHDLYDEDEGKPRFLSQYLARAFHQNDIDLMHIDRSRGDHDFSSCDYLALAEHPELNRIEGEYVIKNGRVSSSRSGVYPRSEHSFVRLFEDKAAKWLGASKCMMTNSGTEANINVLQLTLCGSPRPIYIDKYAHATFPLGARAAGRNDSMYFKHNSVDDLLRLIKEHGPGVVCIDTVYSALGTFAPLEDIVDVCKRHGCILIADETHALGLTGEEGEGLVKMRGLEKDVPFRTSSLGKSFGSGSGLLIFNDDTDEGKHLLTYMGSLPIFSLAPQECVAARHLRGLEIIKNDNWRREELNSKIEFFRNGCMERGYNGLYVQSTITNIIPFVVGNVDFAKEVYDMFIKAHIYPSPHFYPASPRSKSVVRFTICNFLKFEQLQYALDIMEELKPIVKPWEWPDNDGANLIDMGFGKV